MTPCWFAQNQQETTFLFEGRKKQRGDIERCQQWVSFSGHLNSSGRLSFHLNGTNIPPVNGSTHSSKPSKNTQWNFTPQREVLKVGYSKDSHWIQVINIKASQYKPKHCITASSSAADRKKPALMTSSQKWASAAGSQSGWPSPRSKVEFCLLFLLYCHQDQAHYNSLRSTSQQFKLKQVNPIIHKLGGLVSVPDNWEWPGLGLQHNLLSPG